MLANIASSELGKINSSPEKYKEKNNNRLQTKLVNKTLIQIIDEWMCSHLYDCYIGLLLNFFVENTQSKNT